MYLGINIKKNKKQFRICVLETTNADERYQRPPKYKERSILCSWIERHQNKSVNFLQIDLWV